MKISFSFIIISYNRPSDTLNVVNNILSLHIPENDHTEIIVINNGSSIDYKSFEATLITLKKPDKTKIEYIDNPENLGVAGGRNLGIQKAEGDILVFIDDDALFDQKKILYTISDKFKEYKNSNVGIIAFLENRIKENKKYPSTKSKLLWNKPEFLTNFYIGCGHAIKRNVFDSVGFYSQDFFYGVEEYDLAYKAMDQGFRILYTSEISVTHFQNISGRENDLVKTGRMFTNKMIVAWKYLPLFFVFTHFLAWSFYYLYNSKFQIGGWLKATASLWKKLPSYERKVIKKETIQYIRSVQGRLVY